MAAYALGVVILAAGRSQRMGRPKLLLPWGKTTVLGHLLDQWKALGARQIATVGAADDTALLAELDRLCLPESQRIYNPAPEQGMFSSIQCAARWSNWEPALTHWALVLGDQPHLQELTLRQVLLSNAAHPDKICQPANCGHPRHPVMLPKTAFVELGRSAAANLKDFLLTRQRVLCELNDPGLDLDIDRPEDYQQALKLIREK